MDLEISFPSKELLINQLIVTSSYKGISQVYPESAKTAIGLIAAFFSQKDCRSNGDFRSEVNKELVKSIDSKTLIVRDNLEEDSIIEAVTRSLAIVALDLIKKARH